MKRILAAGLAALVLLTGCGRGDDKAGGLTAEDNRQLENAADMLDTSPDSLVPADNAALGNGETSMDAVDESEGGNREVATNAQ